MDDSPERRKAQRMDVSWPVVIHTVSGHVKGETVNLSENGMSICCDDPLPLNEVFKIGIEPPGSPVIIVSGKVLWADLSAIDERDNVVGMGLCFVEISDQDRSFFLNRLSESTP